MSFSSRNLFAQDQSRDGEPAAGPPPPGGDFGNPFFSGTKPNPFSAAGNQTQGSGEGRSFQPDPQPTGRGSFEALFAGKGMGPSPASTSSKMASYSVREILPFLPPALVSTDDLPLDKSIAVPLGADGSTEVKLSSIQAVCPEIFATEITPLKDSEVTLPHRDDNLSASTAPPNPFDSASAGMTLNKEQRPSFFSDEHSASKAKPEPVTASVKEQASAAGKKFSFGNPFSATGAESEGPGKPGAPVSGGNPFSASVEAEEPSGFVNPFASPAPSSEPSGAPAQKQEDPSPIKTEVQPRQAPEPELEAKESPAPAPTPASKSSPFGFPDSAPEGRKSLFGAFGNPPEPASSSPPTPAPAEEAPSNPFGGDFSVSGKSFSGELPDFAKPTAKRAPETAAPANVSLPPENRSESPSRESEPEPSPSEAAPAPAPAPMPESKESDSPFGGNPWMQSASEGDNPFATPPLPASPPAAESPEAAGPRELEAPESTASSGWPPVGEDTNPFDAFSSKFEKSSVPSSPPGPVVDKSDEPSGESPSQEASGDSFEAFFRKTSGTEESEAKLPVEPVPLITPTSVEDSEDAGDSIEAFPPRTEANEATVEGEAQPEAPTEPQPSSGPASSEKAPEMGAFKPESEPEPEQETESPFGQLPAAAAGPAPNLWSGSFPTSIFGGSRPSEEVKSDAGESGAPDASRNEERETPTTGWPFANSGKENSESGSEPKQERKPSAESEISEPAPPKKEAAATADSSSPGEVRPAREGDRLVFSLRDVLLPMTGRTGIEFSNIPPSAKVRLPMGLVEPQLATGEVELRVSDLARYTDPESALLLKRIDPLLTVPLPQNELFHQLQDMAPELLPESFDAADLEAEFSTLFGSEAESDAGLSWLSPPAPAVVSAEELAKPRAESKPSFEEPEPEAQPEVAEVSPVETGETDEPKQPEIEPAGREPRESAEKPAVSKPAPKRVISVTRTTKPKPKPEPAKAQPEKSGETRPAVAASIPTTTPTVSASAAPKSAEQDFKVPVVAEEDPFASFNIPGPLSVSDASSSESKPTSESVEPPSSSPSAPASKSPASNLSDPFAPLPRKVADEIPEAEPEDVDMTFFDDLGEFSGAGSDEEKGKETGDSAPKSKEKKGTVEPQPELPGLSGFARFDDLEPFSPATTREWPGATLPKKDSKPDTGARPAARSAADLRDSEGDAGGFFEELEAEAAPKPAAPQPKPKPQPEKAKPAPASAARQQVEAPVPLRRPEPAPRSAGASSGGSRLRDIELRAVFGTDEDFTFRRVADLTAGLPGVEACAIVVPDMVVQAPRGREAGDLASRAGALVKSARDLAEATGMANSETFTFHTDRGVISIFLHEDCCLTISHAEGQFDPGVREKLILVARGLSGLEN